VKIVKWYTGDREMEDEDEHDMEDTSGYAKSGASLA
jgi:hypothetical protein